MILTNLTDAVPADGVYFLSSVKYMHSPVEKNRLTHHLIAKILDCAQAGKKYFITDLRYEFQVLAAEAVCKAKERAPHIKLVVYMSHIFGYWTGRYWYPDLIARAKQAYRIADIKCCQDPKKIKFYENYAPEKEKEIETILQSCSQIIAYIDKPDYATRLIYSSTVRAISVENIFKIVQKDIEQFLCKEFEPWPVYHSSDAFIQKYLQIFTCHKAICFHSKQSSNYADSQNRQHALKILLHNIILTAIERGYTDFIVSLESINQIIAGQVILQYKIQYPQIRCIVFLLAPITKPRLDWGDDWNEEAKKVYEQSDIHAVFCKNIPSGNYYIARYYHFFLFQFCSQIILLDKSSLDNDAIELLQRVNIKLLDLNWGITKRVTHMNLNLQLDAFYDYIFNVTKSKKITKIVFENLSGMTDKERMTIMNMFFTDSKSLPVHLKLKLSVLEEYGVFGKNNL